MGDWFRSVSGLGPAFVSVGVVTLGLATLIVSGPVAVPRASDAPAPLGRPSAGAESGAQQIPWLDGELGVTGNLDGTYVFDRPAVP